MTRAKIMTKKKNQRRKNNFVNIINRCNFGSLRVYKKKGKIVTGSLKTKQNGNKVASTSASPSFGNCHYIRALEKMLLGGRVNLLIKEVL